MRENLNIETLGITLLNGDNSKERIMVGALLSNLDILKVRFGGIYGNYHFREIKNQIWKDEQFKKAFEHFSSLDVQQAKKLVEDKWFNFQTLDFNYEKLFQLTGKESIENITSIEVQGNGYTSVRYTSGRNSYWTEAMDLPYLQEKIKKLTGKEIPMILLDY